MISGSRQDGSQWSSERLLRAADGGEYRDPQPDIKWRDSVPNQIIKMAEDYSLVKTYLPSMCEDLVSNSVLKKKVIL